MSETLTVGTYARVYIRENGGCYHIDASFWDEIDAAFSDWIERHRDRVLHLKGYDGREIQIAASRISDMSLATPEARARTRDLEAAEKAEAPFTE